MPDRTQLRSLGTGAVGPGTSLNLDLVENSHSSGIITQWIDGGITDASDLENAARTQLPATYPGVSLPDMKLRRVKIRLWEPPGKALAIGYYGASRKDTYNELSISSGYRTATTYKPPDDLAAGDAGTLDPNTGLLRPRQIYIPQLTIWDLDNSDVWRDSRPNLDVSFIGKISGSTENVGGYTFAANTLRFDGARITKFREAGDIKYRRHLVYRYDSASWLTGGLDNTDAATSDFGDPIALRLYDSDFYVSSFTFNT